MIHLTPNPVNLFHPMYKCVNFFNSVISFAPSSVRELFVISKYNKFYNFGSRYDPESVSWFLGRESSCKVGANSIMNLIDQSPRLLLANCIDLICLSCPIFFTPSTLILFTLNNSFFRFLRDTQIRFKLVSVSSLLSRIRDQIFVKAQIQVISQSISPLFAKSTSKVQLVIDRSLIVIIYGAGAYTGSFILCYNSYIVAYSLELASESYFE